MAKTIRHLEEQKVLIGNMAARALKTSEISNIQEAEFKVFSQWGDDGIIQYLIQNIDIPYKTFIEFGVENYTESNTRFLLINNNWSGLILDGSKENMDFVRKSDLFWKYDLQVKDVFITTDNINQLIQEANFHKDVGILSVDIDGNDYWVWKEINVINPIIVISEYNSVFGLNPWTIPYDKNFYRTNKHYSNLYYGTSITSVCDLAKEKGYSFVGTNSNGNNAYFVRNDKLNNLKTVSKEEGFTISKFKESRNERGNLTYVTGKKRIDVIRGCSVFNTKTNLIERI
ncbi:hypothetical protein LR004_00455 [Candidatus Gracilibacteria bacterium]|nr:hypothetical protein [Candidatus Gracilibacteria bacterium]